jgi:signal transduction histidine kinase
MKLAHRYTVLFLVVVIISGGVLFATFDEHRSDLTDNAEMTVEDRAGTMATYLDNELREQQRVVEFAARDGRLSENGTEAQLSRLGSFVETTAFNGVSVVNETGRIQSLVTEDGEQLDLVGEDLSDRTYVQQALRGESYISEPVRAETGNSIIVISAPLTADGKVVGTVNAAYHLSENAIFEVLGTDDEGTAVTVESGEMELYNSLDGGQETISASEQLDTVDWTVKAHQDKQSIDSSVQRLAVFQGLLGLVLLGTLGIFGGWVYRSHIVQISHVLDYLNAFKRGDYNYHTSLGGGGEWDQIEGGLAELGDSLSQREQMLLVHNRILRHNLRNKLNVIRSQAQLLDSKNDDTPRDETREIQRATEKLLQLADRARTTEQLLESPEEREQQTNVARVVRERVDRTEEGAPGLTVNLYAPESLHAICGDEIASAVGELLQNVVDHAGADPVATVTVGEAGDHVVIRVEDNGDGIPEREMSVINGDQDITQLRHTVGIGLWLVDWIVKRYDGTLRVPESDDGCVVEIVLPRAPVPDDEQENTPE